MRLIHLENEDWQVGILPETGGSVAYGRVRSAEGWVDLLRPTPAEDYHRSGACASFLMMPWANRIKDGLYHAMDRTYSLRTVADDGTARHGDVRQRPWQVLKATTASCTLSFSSLDHADLNFPFAFAATQSFGLEGSAFWMEASIQNIDQVPYPAGFGFHPYFVRSSPPPEVMLPCDAMFPLERALPIGPPTKIPEEVDFRTSRPLSDAHLDHLFTQRRSHTPAHILFPAHQQQLTFDADPLFAHYLLYTPTGEPFFALEPQTNANDGFRLFAQGIEGTGVFVLQPHAIQRGRFVLRCSTQIDQTNFF